MAHLPFLELLMLPLVLRKLLLLPARRCASPVPVPVAGAPLTAGTAAGSAAPVPLSAVLEAGVSGGCCGGATVSS